MKSFLIIFFALFVTACVGEPFGECPAVDGETPTYLPDLMDNYVLWECNSGIPRMIVCPKGLIHNPNNNVCDFPSINSKPYGPIGICRKYHQHTLRDGLNVAVFYNCVNGEPIMNKCKNDMWFTAYFGGACFNPKY